MEKLNTVYK